MITVKALVIGDKEVVARLEGLAPRIQDAVVGALNEYSQELSGTIKEDKLSGQVLNVQTGALRDSIAPLEAVKGEVMSGGAGGGAGLVYAHILEYGGIIEHPGGTAYMFKGGVPRFISNAAASAMPWLPRTGPHIIPEPERSYMRSSFRETYEQGLQLVRDAVMEGVAA